MIAGIITIGLGIYKMRRAVREFREAREKYRADKENQARSESGAQTPGGVKTASGVNSTPKNDEKEYEYEPEGVWEWLAKICMAVAEAP
jgi:hypothetical protein